MRMLRTLFAKPWIWMSARLVLFGASAALLLQGAPSLLSAQQPPAAAPVLSYTSPDTGGDAGRRAPAAEVADAPAAAPTRESATASLSAIQVRRELDIPHWLRPGEWVWNEEGAPARGPTIVVVNIRARVLSVYRSGHEIGRSSLIYGADNKPTPVGTFPILEKDADHVSNLYDAPMPHMLRLTWDGIAIHGSEHLADDAATRGCVGLPREFAALLFPRVRIGDRVVIWDGVTQA